MGKFFSCDWGTSALRLRLVDSDTMNVLAETVSNDGVLALFNLWQKRTDHENNRISFYQSFLQNRIQEMEEQLDVSLEGVPLVVSGMASSSVGMLELRYKEVPLSCNDDDFITMIIGPEAEFKHSILLVSGIRTADDVIRGEETQLLGCIGETEKTMQFIFPGTHSKHILVKEGVVDDFKTFMTGEFFELLSKKSILVSSVEESDLNCKGNLKSFESGVNDSIHSNLLHNSFKVRTNQLFRRLSGKENYYYLSGLVIGSELGEITGGKIPLAIVGNEVQTKLYTVALVQLGVKQVKHYDVVKALVNGHTKLFNKYKSEL